MVVYGTLKKGFRNYHYAEPYCISDEPVQFWGRLYDLPCRCPAVQFPRLLLAGSLDYPGDLRRFSELEVDWAARQNAQYYGHGRRETDREGFLDKPSGDWTLLDGELFELQPGEPALKTLDELEFAFVENVLRYYRVAVPVITDDGRVLPAWAYEIARLPEGAERCTGASWKG